MKYNVEILKNMLDNYTMNIKMFSSYSGERAEERMHQLVVNRRYIAALIENDGVRDASFQSFGPVFFDSMLYSAQAGADTSWWTKGT
jgi:hypothetical protein